MNIKEFRLGNLIALNKTVFKSEVDEIGKRIILPYERQLELVTPAILDNISGISGEKRKGYYGLGLTPEWLERLELYNKSLAEFTFKEMKKDLFDVRGGYMVSYGTNEMRIIFVHELQNFYFLELGKELMIEL